MHVFFSTKKLEHMRMAQQTKTKYTSLQLQVRYAQHPPEMKKFVASHPDVTLDEIDSAPFEQGNTEK